MERKAERDFKDQLLRLAPSLFGARGGQFVPSLRQYSKEFVTAGVLAEGVLFQFILGRDDLLVKVAPESKPSDLRDLDEVLNSSDRFRGREQIKKYSTLRVFARLLETDFDAIRAEVQDAL
jgi:hypothetical protein